MNEEFKKMVYFCLSKLIENTGEIKERTCILNSQLLTISEREKFNVSNTFIDTNENTENIESHTDKIIKHCENLNKLCFVAIFDSPYINVKPKENIIGIFVLGIYYNSEGPKNYNKVFAELKSIL